MSFSCHHEEDFSPTRDLLFDFFRKLFSRRELRFFDFSAHCLAVPSSLKNSSSERFVSGHDFSRADKQLFVIPSRLQPAAPLSFFAFFSRLLSRLGICGSDFSRSLFSRSVKSCFILGL